MEKWMKILIILLIFLAIGFFGSKYIKEKLDKTIQEQDQIVSGSNNSSDKDSGKGYNPDSSFGDFGDLFGG